MVAGRKRSPVPTIDRGGHFTVEPAEADTLEQAVGRLTARDIGFAAVHLRHVRAHSLALSKASSGLTPRSDARAWTARAQLGSALFGWANVQDGWLGLLVLPEYRRMGVGRALAQAAQRDSDWIVAEVLRVNQPSRLLLERSGFIFRGARPDGRLRYAWDSAVASAAKR